MKEKIKQMYIWKWMRKYPIGCLILDDVVFRIKVSLYSGMSVNLIYVAVKLIGGILFRSVWLTALSIYYFILALMRYSLIDSARKSHIGDDLMAEYRRYRFCGIVLLFMNLVLIVLVILSVYYNQTFDYPGALIYAMALYAFYALIYSIPSLISFRKHNSPLLSAAKVISLTAALVSMLSLEIAMTARFGGDAVQFRRVMTSVTGAAVCLIVTGMAVYMIVHATKEIQI